MDKYLFSNGTNVIREVHSKEELMELAAQADPQQARVWVFPSNEWMTLARFRELNPPARQTGRTTDHVSSIPRHEKKTVTRRSGFFGTGWKLLTGLFIVAAIFLVYNFTRDKWQPLAAQTVTPGRPDNTPPVNIDSLIAVLEASRGTKLDKVTRTNLRIRNNWPDQVLLQVKTDRDSSQAGIRYSNMEWTLDNATGYMLDEVEAELSIWRNGEVNQKESLTFTKINYTEPGKKITSNTFVGDSISVRVLQIRAKSFNFCYSHDKQSNYGNMNDRWFCR